MSAPGSKATHRIGRVPRRVRGFTLIELMIVVTLIAIASGVAMLALRDPAATQLEREGARLAALLESARAEARAAGVAVQWKARPATDGVPGGFEFTGLPARLTSETAWLNAAVTAELRTALGPTPAIVLGPEPVIGAQRIVLHLDSQHLTLATDGLGPFVVADEAEVADAGRR